MSENDTIAAIATAPGLSGIGVVRVSGPKLDTLIMGMVGRTLAPRKATLANFRDGRSELIDQGIALFFPAPHSYTGEDVLELQGHGGPVVQQLLLKRCMELGARLARPGEFTQRAYLNDKLDLAQAESVADLINAATSEAARSALRSLQGAFSEQVNELVRALIELRARIEATLDFPEEEIEFLKEPDTRGELETIRARLQSVLAHSRQGSLLREGVRVVLAGQPNVGKSSLLNRLAGEELAIVTEIPGTTRDVIRQSLSLRGVPFHIIDTAGLHNTKDPVERIGIERTWAAIERADVVLLIMEATHGEQEADLAILRKLPGSLPCIKVMNKVDLAKDGRRDEARSQAIWLSAKTGIGVDRLQQQLLEKAGWQGTGEGLFIARERHVQALQQAKTHLDRATGLYRQMELYAEELRLAQERLGAITGEFTADDLLGEIFSRFCIGK